MPRIAISYRDDDFPGAAQLILDRLSKHFGSGSVIVYSAGRNTNRDLSSTDPGSLETVDYLLVLIGPRWLGSQTSERSTIADANDNVRLEIERALELNVRIVPVRLENAPIPSRHDLPKSIDCLSDLNALELTMGRDFDLQIDRIIRFINRTFVELEAHGDKETTARSARTRRPLGLIFGVNTFARRKSWQVIALRALLTGLLVVVQLLAFSDSALQHIAYYGFRELMLVDSILLTLLGSTWLPFLLCGLLGVCGSLVLEDSFGWPLDVHFNVDLHIAVGVAISLFLLRGLLETAFSLILYRLVKRVFDEPSYRVHGPTNVAALLDSSEISVERMRGLSAALWTGYLFFGYFVYLLRDQLWFDLYDDRMLFLRAALQALAALIFGLPSAGLMILTARKLFLLDRLSLPVPNQGDK